jgi:hypothetical protein
VVANLKKTLHTFTTGSTLKYFKLQKKNKALRGNLKSTGMLLNFIKVLVKKNYQAQIPILSIVGFNYNLLMLKRQIKEIMDETCNKPPQTNTIKVNNSICNSYFLFNLKLNFSKKRGKKVKAIKRRLYKKILLNFLKTINVKH